MKVLAITTSTARIGVAVADADGVRASWSAVRGRAHAELLAPAIARVCDSAEMALGEVGVVAVDTGPGLFTGLRVGVASAKACAFALGVPMIGLSSLDVLAFGVRFADRRVTAVLDARRGELFVASYVGVPGGMQRVDDPRTVTPDDLVAELAAHPEPQLLIGNGAHRYADRFTSLDRVEVAGPSRLYPSADTLALLAHAAAMREEWVGVNEITCTYLRQPDAEINWQTRDRQVTG